MTELQQRMGAAIFEAIAPALIMMLIGSLMWFGAEIAYYGEYLDRVRMILGLWVFGSVLVCRIAVTEGQERSVMFGLPLAAVVWIAMMRFVEVRGVLGPFEFLLHIIFISVSWWCASKLVWDCTVVDSSRDTTSQGLLGRVRLDRLFSADEDSETDSTETSDEEIFGATGDAPVAKPNIFQLIVRMGRKQNTPGLSVVYFSLAAIPIFGFGQGMISAENEPSRQFAFQMFVCYMIAALGLLLTTSLLSLQQYLFKRDVAMPNPVALTWVATGLIAILVILGAAWILPRPYPEYSIGESPIRYESPKDLQSSRHAMFGDDGPDDRETDRVNQEREKTGSQVSNEGKEKSNEGNNSKSKNETGGGKDKGKSKGESDQSKSKQQSKSESDSKSKSKESKSGSKSDESKGKQGTKRSESDDNGKQKSDSKSQEKSDSKQSDSKQSDAKQSDSKQSDSKQNDAKSDESQNQSDNKQAEDDKGSSEKNNSDEPRDDKSRDERNQDRDSEQSESDDSRDDSGNDSEQQEEEQNKSDSQQADKPRQKMRLNPTVGSFVTIIKWLFYIIAAVVVVFFGWKYRKRIAQAWKEFVAELKEFFARLFGGKKKAEMSVGEEIIATAKSHRSFHEFTDPFESGRSKQMTSEELARYCFAAFDAWAADHGVPRDPDQTPNEFAKLIGERQRRIKREAKSIAEIYSAAVYSNSRLSRNVHEKLEHIWRLLQTTDIPPLRETVDPLSGNSVVVG